MISRAFESRTELISRCRRLLAALTASDHTFGIVVIHDDNHTIHIKRLKSELWVDSYPGGRVYSSPLPDFGVEEYFCSEFAEDIVLPILRKHMVLDDLSAV